MSDRSKSDENRIRWIAAWTLGCVMAGHTMLETARDALFLANVSVERLPFVTIAIALLALLASREPARFGHRRVLLALVGLAAVGTIGFWQLVTTVGDWSYYGLYVWSGIITTLIVVRFWLLLGDLFTITQGKRVYAAIALGGSVGALLGSMTAALLAPSVGGEGLLVGASLAFAASAFGPGRGLGAKADQSGAVRLDHDMTNGSGFAASVSDVLRNPYACRVAALVVVAGITLTLGDYLFKSVLAEEVASDQLATVLSRIYLGLNVLSIGMLAIGVTPVVRRIGVDRSLAVLPAFIGLGGVGVLAGGALGATVFLKAADGTLRYSLHKTALELLYLPMSSSLRRSVKAVIDIVGQAGAKALGSLLILGLVLSPEPRLVVAFAVVASAAAWVFSAILLRSSYLNVFRQTLGEGMIETEIDHPELDLDSATSLIRALSEPDERRVIAAMRMLTERGHVALIPSLILYHPSPRVVTHALDTFAVTRREDLLGLLEHLIDHEDGNVRAATVRAAWVLDPDLNRLRELRDSECTAIRVSAAHGLLAAGDFEPAEFLGILDEAIDYESYEPRLAAATAARLHYHAVAREALVRLAGDENLEVAEEAVRAICASGDEWFTEPLVGLLGERRVRDGVRAALLERGDAALRVLAERLVDPTTPVPILRHIPRTIARFGSQEASNVLIESLSSVESGMVRYKLLRGLETMHSHRRRGGEMESGLIPALDVRGIRAEFDRTLDRSLDLLHLEAELARMQSESSDRATVGGELLVELLQDKRDLATGRLFAMLGLIYPNEDFRVIRSGLRSALPTDRASAMELIETLLSREVGSAILGLVMAGSADALLAVADPVRKGRHLDYGSVVRALLQDESHSVRAVALYHAGEVGIELDSETVREADSDGDPDRGPSDLTLQERGLAILRELSDQGARRTRPVAQALLAK
jgi:AAA family ATP:ADP antiporter